MSRGATIALLMCDLQNDFVHPLGAYGRAGQTAPEIAALPARLGPLAELVRARGGWIVSTHFTLVPGKGGEPLISPHLRTLRPFLSKGDFQPGLWGHALVDELAPADAHVRDLSTLVLCDGCADFSPAQHEMAIAALRSIVPLLTVAEAMEELRQ